MARVGESVTTQDLTAALPPAALEDLVQQVKEFDVDAATAAHEGDQA